MEINIKGTKEEIAFVLGIQKRPANISVDGELLEIVHTGAYAKYELFEKYSENREPIEGTILFIRK
jgi:hypothetical protein